MDQKLPSAITYIKGDKLPSAIDYIKVDEEKVKDPEKRIYVILYYADIDDDEIKSFEVTIGRKATYEFIKNIAEYSDLHESKVLAEGVDYNDALSMFDFMIVMENYFDDSFDIRDYDTSNN